MEANKIILNSNVLIDLTEDTAVESDVAQGKTFHLADGTIGVGTATGGSANPYESVIDNQTQKGMYLFADCSDDNTAFANHFTSEVKAKMTTLEGAFFKCENLTSMDLTGLTGLTGSNLKLASTFMRMTSLTSISFGALSSKKLGETSNTFNGCSSLVTIDMSAFTSSQNSHRNSMFEGCGALTTFIQPSTTWGTSGRAFNMFNNCSGLTTLDISNFANISPSQHNAFSMMFANCLNLQTLSLWDIRLKQTDDIYRMFYNCTSLTTINYAGTKQNWKDNIAPYATLFDANNLTQNTITVQCSDGQLVYNNDGSGNFSITENSTTV